jgi:UDP-N-acetylmuramoyl-L-alanyl-D-glutamate--2,6-diaminopimelate ligase
VVIAGKGHEKYQEIKGVRTHFDDKEQLLEVFSMMG